MDAMVLARLEALAVPAFVTTGLPRTDHVDGRPCGLTPATARNTPYMVRRYAMQDLVRPLLGPVFSLIGGAGAASLAAAGIDIVFNVDVEIAEVINISVLSGLCVAIVRGHASNYRYFTNVEGKLSSLDQRLENVEGELERVDARLGRLEGERSEE